MTTGRLAVRPATPDDALAIAQLLFNGSREPAAEHPDAPWRYEAAMARVRAGGGEVLVADLDGEVVGVAQLSLLAHLQHAGGTVAEVESVHVAATHRRRGVGRALLGSAVAWARRSGCYRVQLTSHRDREAAHHFYESVGFSATHVGYKLALLAVAVPPTPTA